LLSLWVTPKAWAQGEDEEYNFNWLDPDKKIYVLQNRKFLKGRKFLISAMAGVGMSNSYRNVFNIDPRIAYYLNEAWGLEVFYSFSRNTENKTYEHLKKASPNALPSIREVLNQFGAVVHWSPWYAKINVFNQILYFDWFFQAGLGQMGTQIDTRTKVSQAANYQVQSFTSFLLGTGHQFHLSQMFVVRLDLLTSLYQARVFGTTGDNRWFTNYNFNMGIGLRL